MTESHSDTYHYLLTHYGPLLTLEHLAEVLHSTPDALRMAISRQRQPLTEALAQSRRQVGRRLFFEARRVAEIIDQDHGATHKRRTKPHVKPRQRARRARSGQRP